MSDASLNQIIQYGTAAARAAFTPDPAVGSQVLYVWYDTDSAPDVYIWDGSAWVLINGGASGDVVGPGSAVDGHLALFDGTSGKLIKDGGAPSSGLLAIHQYAPASNTIFSTSSSTWADIDATNLIVTPTIPASGSVLVRLTAYCDLSTSVQEYFWALRSGSSNITGSGGVATRSADGFCVSVAFMLTGLTPAATPSWKWAHAASGGATGRLFAGPGLNAGTASTSAGVSPATMEVWSA
jgi:hypothetical protein